jgi:CheY-like chemotaxis protein
MAGQSKQLNILLADDETSTTASVSHVLKRCGHLVDVVHDGEDAFLKLKQAPDRYQILITDHKMMRVSGVELLERLRKTDFCGKIVVLSGYLTRELDGAYRALGAHRLISKPFDLPELRGAIYDLGKIIHGENAPS